MRKGRSGNRRGYKDVLRGLQAKRNRINPKAKARYDKQDYDGASSPGGEEDVDA